MIRRKLFIATVIIASIVITACSDMTAPKNDPGVLTAVARAATVVATINGVARRRCNSQGSQQGQPRSGWRSRS